MKPITPRNSKMEVRAKIMREHRQADNKFIKLIHCTSCKAYYYDELMDAGQKTITQICKYCGEKIQHIIHPDETIILDRKSLIMKIMGMKGSMARKTETIRRKELEKRKLQRRILELEMENYKLRRELIKKERY